MTRTQWERVKTIFEKAIVLPEPDRAVYVRTRCADDPEVCQEALTLVLNDDQPSFSPPAEPPAVTARVFSDGEMVAGRFRIERFLSRGGIGEVYEVFDKKLERRIALKTLRPEFAADREALSRFRREIRVAQGATSHPNLCRVFDLVEHQPTAAGPVIPCLTMELLEGESLMAYLERIRPLPMDVTLAIITQVADALEKLHDNGVIHRDLKPSNIFLKPLGDGQFRAVLMDFGLAKPLDAAAELFESRTESQVGAPYFMAPELFKRKAPGKQSDIYALGMVLDEMVTRRRAYAAESLLMLCWDKLQGEMIPPEERATGLPSHVRDTIRRCVDNDPEKRFSSVRDFKLALSGEPVSDCLPARAARNRVFRWRTSRSGRNSTRLLVALALVAVLAGLLALDGVIFAKSRTTVLVFPMQNLTGRVEFDYLCRGTTTELMRRLSQVPGVRVIPYYDPRPVGPVDPRKAAFWMDGTMQAYSGQVRMNVELIQSASGELVWSDNFDRQIHNPLELQSEIAEGTASSLNRRLLADGGRRGPIMVDFVTAGASLRHWLGFQVASVPGAPTTSSAALDLYMRGRYLWDERTLPSTLAAMGYFQQAVNEDPNFALAYSAMADVQQLLMDFSYAPLQQLANRAREYAERAVSLGPNLPEAHTSLAWVLQTLWDWRGADASYREALRLNPRFARGRRWYAGMELQFARFDEALTQTRLALADDPYDYPSQAAYGLYLFWAGKPQEAVSQLVDVLAKKNDLRANVNLGEAYAFLASDASGRQRESYFEKALQQAAAVRQIELRIGGVSIASRGLRLSDRMFAQYYAMAGRSTEAQPYLERIMRDLHTGRTSPVAVSWIYAALGDKETAINLLQRGATVKDRNLLYIKVNPAFRPLRGDARFQAILEGMRLPT